MKLAFSALLIFVASLLHATRAVALDPDRSIGQYKHTKWTIDEGAPPLITEIVQGSGGYLWIGTAAGLFRFDGISFAAVTAPGGEPRSGVSSLLVSRNGDVWAGYASGGTAVYRRGRLRDVPFSNTYFVMNLAETRDGRIWAILGNNTAQISMYQNGRWQDVSSRLRFPAEQPIDMLAGNDGTLWVTTESALLYLRPKAARFEHVKVSLKGHASVAEDNKGRIWLSDGAGSRLIVRGDDGRPSALKVRYPTSTAKRAVGTLFDRDGNLWGRLDFGLFRVPNASRDASTKVSAKPSVETFALQDGLLAPLVNDMIEDREGNIWIGSTIGLERFRPARVVNEPALTKKAFWGDTLLGASDGSVYVGEADAVYRIPAGGNPEVILRAPEAQALCEAHDGSIWIILQDRALRFNRGRFERISVPPRTATKVADCAVDRFNRLWLAATGQGLFGHIDGAWKQILSDSALKKFTPKFFLRRPDRSLIIAFETTSMANFDPPKSPRLSALPPVSFGTLMTLFETGDGFLVGGEHGLGLIQGGQIRVLSTKRFPYFQRVSGIVRAKSGQSWMSSSAGIVGVSTNELHRAFNDPQATIRPLLLDFRDGLVGSQNRDIPRSAVQGGDGRIWFSNGEGTVWIDPENLPRNAVIPKTAISAIMANGVRYVDPSAVRLSPGTARVEINFSALSLSIPERVTALYKMEGADENWVNPGMRRQAFYTNLGPGRYVFRVIAANEDGVWNRTGTSLEIEIPPTFLQSKWFSGLCVLLAGLFLWAAYRLRIRQVQSKLRLTLEGRLAERERIARDLHDTLLQGFQGLILRFQSIANGVPRGEPMRESIEQALDSADNVLQEGRDSVLHLRADHVIDLSQSFAIVAERLRLHHPAEFNLVVEGDPRPLQPVVREELARIGEEALTNAFQHAEAKKIELALAYGVLALKLGVRDDGSGIPAEIFARGGRQGHFGLIGMRERAAQIDAKMKVSSGPGAGTEVSVIVPGRVAYVEKHAPWWKRASRLVFGSKG